MKTRTSLHAYGVDEGYIGVMDSGLLENKRPEFCRAFEVGGPGEYKVTLKIRETWNGPKQRTMVLKTRTGCFVVGDICYMISDRRHEFYQMASQGEGWFCVDTGGDGRFDARVTFERVDKVSKVRKVA